MTEGAFVCVAPRCAFIRPDGDDHNVFLGSDALTALPRAPRRGDRAEFQITEHARRRVATDITLIEGAPARC